MLERSPRKLEVRLSLEWPHLEWLGLVDGTDLAGCIDLAGLTRVHNPQYNSHTHFGLDHVATAWLGEALAGGERNA